MNTTPVAPVQDYAALNPRSRECWERACRVIVGGGQLHKRPYKYMLRGGPSFAARAKGARFWDVDGREYLDYLLSYGPIVLGHADPDVNEAVRNQMEEGTLYSVEHPAAIELAEQLCATIPCAEMVMFLLGGSSATQAAVRCARAHTGREIIIRCGYHGWLDWCFPNDPGSPRFNRELTLETPYNDLAALQSLLETHPGRVAGVIIEAVQGDGPSADYFPGVRRLCDEHGAVFILDEVKTGCRFDLGGAQVPYDIRPDLATFGKAMANGYPGSVLAGRRAFMQPRTDSWIAATFHGDLLSVAAMRAVLRLMRERDGIAYFQKIGRRLMDGLDEVFRATGYPLRMCSLPPMPGIAEQEAPPEFKGKVITEWCAAMQRRGIYVTGHVWFLSLAHTEADIEQTISAGADAANEAWAVLKDIVAGKQQELPWK
jgi:glutamate-1-semialdehyde 2,1-aminomutase